MVFQECNYVLKRRYDPGFFRPTWMELELDSVLSNVQQIKKYIGNDVHLMAVVKANAYEYGALEVSEVSILGGATWLGVATFDEALSLRIQLSQNVSILVLGYASPAVIPLASRHRITLTAISLQWIQEAAEIAQHRFDFHLKMDTGMNRVGVKTFEELRSVAEIVSGNMYMNWTGAYTHFASSENMQNKTFFYQQLELFHEFLTVIPQRDSKILHCANSGATLMHIEKPFFNMVRVGIGLYGRINANYSLVPLQRTRNSLYSTLVLVKQLEAGESVGYGQSYRTTRKEWIGTVPIGRLDGWETFDNTEVLVEGKHVPIIGSISLDQLMVALPEEYPVGTTVTFIENFSRFSVVSQRLPRIYLLNNTIVSMRNPLLETINLF